jgi:glutamate synthase domain-containing protein 2
MFATNKVARWFAGGGIMLLIPLFALRYSYDLAALSDKTTYWAVGALLVTAALSHVKRLNFLGLILGTLAAEILVAHFFPGDLLWIPLTFLATFIGQTAAADAWQEQHSILRAALVLGHFRRGAEEVRPELQDWILERDGDGTPAPRYIRAEVIQFAKKEQHEVPLGTKLDYRKKGLIRIPHADPETILADSEEIRLKPIVIGPYCAQPWISYGRLHVGDASFGSLGQNAVESLSSGAKFALRFMQTWYGQEVHGCIHTGEGGLTPYHLNGVFIDPTWQQRVAQSYAYGMSFLRSKYRRPPFPRKGYLGGGDVCLEFGTAHFGARTADGDFDLPAFVELMKNPQIKAFKFKLSQGAKPGGGGILPAAKITLEISKIRGIPMGKDCISPNIWKEFRTIEEMMIFGNKLRQLCGKPWGIKFCVGKADYVRKLAQWMKDHPPGKDVLYGPDFIHIDGGEGGTGAAPPMRVDFIGMSIYHSLPLVDNILRQYGVRNDVVLMSSGKIYSPAHLFIHLALGADIGCAVRGPMTAVGCLQAFKCHTGQCPTGVATHHPWLQRALVPRIKYLRVANYLEAMHTNLIELLRTVGVHDTFELNRSFISYVEDYGEPEGTECYPYPTEGLAGSKRKPPTPEAFGLDKFGRPLSGKPAVATP